MTYYPFLTLNPKLTLPSYDPRLFESFRHGTPHAGLLGKLEHYGIDSKILLWITNFLNNRKQRVVVDGSFSNYADIESGVPQGTVLGPLLFLLHKIYL